MISLKILVQRSLLKSILSVFGSAQIPFRVIHTGLNLQNQHLSDEELCSLLSLLKYKVREEERGVKCRAI